jgi:hypothetical protein
MLQGPYAALEEYTATQGYAGMPLNVPLSGTTYLGQTFIQVPTDEVWLITAAGLYVLGDDNRISLSITNERIPQTWIELGTAGVGNRSRSTIREGSVALAATPRIPIPNQIIQSGGSAISFVGISLQGVSLQPGDFLVGSAWASNSDGSAAHNVIGGGLLVRYKPVKVVSEQSVSLLPGQREDAYLNQRLVQRR